MFDIHCNIYLYHRFSFVNDAFCTLCIFFFFSNYFNSTGSLFRDIIISADNEIPDALSDLETLALQKGKKMFCIILKRIWGTWCICYSLRWQYMFILRNWTVVMFRYRVYMFWWAKRLVPLAEGKTHMFCKWFCAVPHYNTIPILLHFSFYSVSCVALYWVCCL